MDCKYLCDNDKLILLPVLTDFPFSGDQLKNKQFLTSAAQIGLLANRTNNGLNLINVNSYATDGGLKVAYEHKPNAEDNAVTLSFSSNAAKHALTGK